MNPILLVGRLVRSKILLGAGILAICASGARAATSALGEFTNISLGGGLFDYTITLVNIGTTPIETFWYAWIPGQDYLKTSPTNIQSPSGWSQTITHGSSSDGYAIQWTTSLAPLPAGGSFTFSFESTDTPEEVAGNSVFFPSTPVGTSFVYQGVPFSPSSDEFVVTSAEPVPEPSTADLAIAAACGMFFLRARKVLSF